MWNAAVSPDGDRAYAIGSSVWVVDTATDEIIAAIPLAGIGESMAVTPDGGSVYRAKTCCNSVSHVSTETNEVSSASVISTATNEVTASISGLGPCVGDITIAP